MIHLINITALPPGGATPTTLRFCSGAAGFRTSPTETPPNAMWLPGVNVAYHFTRELFGGNDAGASRVGAGEIELTNDDGRLDIYDSQDWGFDGQAVEVLSGQPGQAYADFTPVFRGVIESTELTWNTFTLSIRDRQKELDKPLPIPKYAGTNSGPTGVEGTADDIKGKYKPLALGNCPNVEPVQVNSSKLIYQVHFRTVQGIPAVYSNASALTLDGDDATATALAAATIASGHYRTCKALGLFRINASQDTTITADVLGDAVDSYINTTAGLIQRLLEIHGWSAGADWSAASLAALAAKNSAEIGLYDDSGAKVRALLDEVCAGAWAYYCPDTLGVFRFGRVEAPGTPTRSFADYQMIDLQRVTNDLVGAPLGLVTCKYGRNWNVQKDNQVAAVVSDTKRSWLALEYRTATSTTDGEPSPTVLSRHPLAENAEFTSLFVATAAALAEAQRRADFRSTPRRAYSFKLDPSQAVGLDLGHCVALTSRRFGLAATPMTVCGMDETPAKAGVEVTVYG